MNVPITGVIHTEVERHPDARGFFNEISRAGDFDIPFVQANHSRSIAGVLRGLHFHQRQADLWYVAGGKLKVGLADLRSPSNVTRATVDMSSDSPATLYIPPGVAHGFFAVTDCDLIYWVSAFYDASDEFGVAWDDDVLAVDWGVSNPILSERDRTNPPLDWGDIPSFS